MSLVISAENTNYSIASTADNVPISSASGNSPNRDCRVGDRLYTLVASPYPDSTIFSRADELAAWETCERVYKAVVTVELSNLPAC